METEPCARVVKMSSFSYSSIACAEITVELCSVYQLTVVKVTKRIAAIRVFFRQYAISKISLKLLLLLKDCVSATAQTHL